MQYQQVQSWQGPFPPPDAIRSYEETLPGAFDRILKMAEEAQRAQRHSVFSAQELAAADTRRGQCLGAAITALAMVGAAVCAWIGQPWVAGGFLSVPVMAVAKALVDSRKRLEAPSNAETPDRPQG